MLYDIDISDRYSPMYFLGALGAGGLAVSFFMYIMWMTPHQMSPIPSFESVRWAMFEGSLLQQVMAVIGLIGVAVFTVEHFRLLIWNFLQYSIWKETPAFAALCNSTEESQLMIIPLTLAVTINLIIIVGIVFMPGLWEAREILFPLSLLAFVAVGFYALKIYLRYFSRSLTDSKYDCSKNNSLGQILSILAFSMLGMGFSVMAAMSKVKAVVAIGFMFSSFFVISAILLGIISLALIFRAMMEHKDVVETVPALLMVVPILTVLGVSIYRLELSLWYTFGVEVLPGSMFAFFAVIFSIQLLFSGLSWAVMHRGNYIKEWVSGSRRSAGAYALVCSGVSLFVIASFLISFNLVKVGLLEAMSVSYWIFYMPLIILQFIAVCIFYKLNRKLLAQ